MLNAKLKLCIYVHKVYLSVSCTGCEYTEDRSSQELGTISCWSGLHIQLVELEKYSTCILLE